VANITIAEDRGWITIGAVDRITHRCEFMTGIHDMGTQIDDVYALSPLGW